MEQLNTYTITSEKYEKLALLSDEIYKFLSLVLYILLLLNCGLPEAKRTGHVWQPTPFGETNCFAVLIFD